MPAQTRYRQSMRTSLGLFLLVTLLGCQQAEGTPPTPDQPPAADAPPPPPAACRGPGLPQRGLRTTTATVHAGDKAIPLTVELCLNNRQREVGMMCRTEAPDDAGMLFVFEREGRRSFWMKNTLVPLDIIFLDASHRVVNVQADAAPLTLSPRPSLAPAQYVLEVRGGWAKDHGLAPGDQVAFTLPNAPAP